MLGLAPELITDASLTLQGLWDGILWVLWCYSVLTDASASFCSHTKVISHSLLYLLRPESKEPFYFLDAIVADLSRRPTPVNKHWTCLVFATHQRWPESHFQTPIPKFWNGIRVQVRIFFLFANQTLV